MTAVKALSHRAYIAVASSEAQLRVLTLQCAGHVQTLLSPSTGTVRDALVSRSVLR